MIGRMEQESREELEATLAARRELGPDHDEHLVAGFLERIEKEIDRRVDERVAARAPRRDRPLRREEIGIFVPIVIAAGIFGGPAGVFTALAALVIVFLVLTVSRR
jgi:hypothetical protein